MSEGVREFFCNTFANFVPWYFPFNSSHMMRQMQQLMAAERSRLYTVE